MTPVEATVTLVNRNGLHARPAHLFVQIANRFQAELKVGRDGYDTVDGKSIMGIMMLAAEHGASELDVRFVAPTEGVDVTLSCAAPDGAQTCAATTGPASRLSNTINPNILTIIAFPAWLCVSIITQA